MSVARLQLAPVGKTVFPPRAHFFFSYLLSSVEVGP
jgi:hypothetical protein